MIKVSLTYDSFYVLMCVLDACRTGLMKPNYEAVLDVTVELTRQVPRDKRVADVISFEVKRTDYVLLWECITMVELFGMGMRTEQEIDMLKTELEWSCTLADALL